VARTARLLAALAAAVSVAAMDDQDHFTRAYAGGSPPWDRGKPDPELIRVLDAGLLPGRTVLEFGCGYGDNAVELARRGYQVTAVDFVAQAVEEARRKARAAKVTVDFRCADVIALKIKRPFDVLFDRGCYHHLRRADLAGFQGMLRRVTRPGTRWFCLAGNAKQQTDSGPPRVHEHEIRAELGPLFEILDLRDVEVHNERPGTGVLFWAILLQRRAGV
jgi:cyclopropane fatty-acyl-phospholipid synthase-like methyltransferase